LQELNTLKNLHYMRPLNEFLNESVDPKVLAAIETIKKVKVGPKRKEAMAIVLDAAKAKTGESARTYKQALQFLDLEDL